MQKQSINCYSLLKYVYLLTLPFLKVISNLIDFFVDIKKDGQIEENQRMTPLSFLIKSLTSFVINTLSLCACKEKKISQNALNSVASFFIDSLRSVVDSSVSAWGEFWTILILIVSFFKTFTRQLFIRLPLS